MQCPVTVVETGVTYDQRSIEQWWFKRNQRSCPATQRLVKSLDLKPNSQLKAEIDAWLLAHPGYVTTLEQEDEVQQQLFGTVDSDAVVVHRSLEALCAPDPGARSAGLIALCERTGWPELPSTLLCTGAYLELVQTANVGAPEEAARSLRLLRHVAKTSDGLTALVEAGFLDTCVSCLRGREHLAAVHAAAARRSAAATSNASASASAVGPGATASSDEVAGAAEPSSSGTGSGQVAQTPAAAAVAPAAAAGGAPHGRALPHDTAMSAALGARSDAAATTVDRAGGRALPAVPDDTHMRQQAVGALLALAGSGGGHSGTAHALHTRARMLYGGVVQGLIELLDSSAGEAVQDRAAKLLCKLADTDAHDFWRQLSHAAPVGWRGGNAAGCVGGGLDVLVDLLSSPSSRCQQYTLQLLLRLAAREEYRLRLVEAGCAAMPIRLLRSRHAAVSDYAVSLLCMFATGEACKLKLLDMVGVAPFAALLMSDNDVAKRHGGRMLAQLITPEDGHSTAVCHAVIEQGGVSVLLGLVGQPEPATREKGAALLSKLACACGRTQAANFLHEGVAEPLVALLQGETDSCAEHAAAAIGHLAVNSAAKRAFVDAGAVRPLLQLSQQKGAQKKCREAADHTLKKLVGLTMSWYLRAKTTAA